MVAFFVQYGKYLVIFYYLPAWALYCYLGTFVPTTELAFSFKELGILLDKNKLLGISLSWQ